MILMLRILAVLLIVVGCVWVRVNKKNWLALREKDTPTSKESQITKMDPAMQKNFKSCFSAYITVGIGIGLLMFSLSFR